VTTGGSSGLLPIIEAIRGRRVCCVVAAPPKCIRELIRSVDGEPIVTLRHMPLTQN